MIATVPLIIRRSILLSTAMLGTVLADSQPINCALPHTDNRLSQCAVVHYASEYPSCLSATDITQHTCIVMDSDLSFCENTESLPLTTVFDRSDKTLDCRGGTIDHGWGRVELPNGPVTTEATRIPAVRFMDDRSLTGITIQNCTIRGTNHIGIQATRFFGGELGGDGVLSEGEPLPVGHGDLVLRNLTIEDTGLGIYLGTYSHNVSIDNVVVDRSERIAIYSEAGTHNLSITNSVITNNQTREAIAIDSTYDSVIENNLFVNNREGGINLYQNCGELKGIVCPVVRSTPSNNNVVQNNAFVNTGISGVQVASRQGRNHSLGWCATLNGLPGQFTDTSRNNTVSNNVFICQEGTALLVKDGPNTVENNRIVARDQCVPFEISTGGLGSSASERLNGIKMKGNQIDATLPPKLRNLGSDVVVD
ncbi:MAG: right-handed parallel beta-helix repeat-containing protein [Gammaproteobacteria bacterium]|nr:right-handed parallel beta-helix repeat-containing protein [Gammaproteobacteria bacterium]